MMNYEPVAPGKEFKYCKWDFNSGSTKCPEKEEEEDDAEFDEDEPEDEEKEDL